MQGDTPYFAKIIHVFSNMDCMVDNDSLEPVLRTQRPWLKVAGARTKDLIRELKSRAGNLWLLKMPGRLADRDLLYAYFCDAPSASAAAVMPVT
jgi:hypothetical protein